MTTRALSTDAVPGNVLRLLDGRPQTTILRRTGWHRQYLSDRMTGRTAWTGDDIVALCKVLDVDADTILAAPPFVPTTDHRWASNEDADRPTGTDRCLACRGVRWGPGAVGPECTPTPEAAP